MYHLAFINVTDTKRKNDWMADERSVRYATTVKL